MIGGAVSYVWGSQASLLGRDLGLRRRWGWQASVLGQILYLCRRCGGLTVVSGTDLGVLPTLRVRSVSYASNSWPSADAGPSKRRCWAKFWTAADAENAHSGVGLPACGSLAPLGGVPMFLSTPWGVDVSGFRLAVVGALRPAGGVRRPFPCGPVQATRAGSW